jgi:leucyl-tRNA synthetase
VNINFKKIEEKWQKRWEKAKIFQVKENKKKKKFYVLEMYPYPSASFLHMGHVRNYTIGDVLARFKRMNGFNVLYPMGYDSFGLPAEQSAKKEGIHPKKYTDFAIKKIMEYQKALGNSYDWSRVIASHDPNYYKWNQFFFLKLFEKGLAYRKKALVNWCENCESVLANEEAESGKCWRCENKVTKKNLEQWFFKITDYADRLLKDLEKVDWPENIKIMQRNWIGRSEGIEINFEINGKTWKIFTTRPDTIYGVTFLVISAQHPNLMEIVTEEHKKEVEEFLEKVNSAVGKEALLLEKEGVFTGSYAIHPLTNEKIPVYVGNFVLADYASGMIMAVPAHDQRDFEFAKKYNIPIKVVIQPNDVVLNPETMTKAYEGEGILVNSDKFNGLNSSEAREKISEYLESQKLGERKVYYKLRDWLISRQRYWGTPIPIIYCKKCGIVPVPEKDLPVLLPEKVNFKSKGNPLEKVKKFVNTKCPKCGLPAKRETDTLGGFMDSSWYFLRYCDPKNKNKPFDEKKVDYWMPVDQYIGGAEHAVMHLIYARFFVKVLKDLGFVKFDEPFMKLFNQGIVYKDGAKMSKSKGNVVFQTEISDKYGIDTARLFLMFVASPDKQMEWSDEGVEGAFRIIKKLIRLKDKITKKTNERQENKINITIKEVTEAIEKFDYPNAIKSILEAINYFSDFGISKKNYEILLKLIHPFCPHITEELWHNLGNKTFISLEKWPRPGKINERLLQLEEIFNKTMEDIRHVISIVGKKEKLYIYTATDDEFEFLNESKELIKNKLGFKEVFIFKALDENKYDPQNKSSKAKFGKPGIYME